MKSANTNRALSRRILACGLVAGISVTGLAQELLPPASKINPPNTLIESTTSRGLDDLIRIALERHPRLAQSGLAIDAAQGRAIQAGLYPNPTVQVVGDELGDRQGPAGIWTVPQVTQEIVTGGKLRLSKAAACKEVDQATLALTAQRYALLSVVRQNYFDVLALQQRLALLRELGKLAEQSVDQTRQLLDAKQAARLDLIQLEVEMGRVQAELASVDAELPAALRRLSASTGDPLLEIASIEGNLDQLPPPYELERLQRTVIANHPEVASARVGIERAQLLLARAKAEPIPNVTVGAGYVRQSQNNSNDGLASVSIPIPVWNRNQGNIRAAQAQYGDALQEVRRVEADLAERAATAYRDYAAARRRAEKLDEVRRKAFEAFEITRGAATLSTLQRLESQRALYQARLEYLKALGDAWKAASVISGLTLEERWPQQIEPGIPVPMPAKP